MQEQGAGAGEAVMTTMRKTDLLALADRVEELAGPCRDTDLDVQRLVAAFGETENPPAPEGCTQSSPHMDGVPHYTASIDDALSLVGDRYLLSRFGDIVADGLPGCIVCTDTSTTPPKEHLGVSLEGRNRRTALAIAATAAAIRALAEEVPE
jgi:hypothetical protein